MRQSCPAEGGGRRRAPVSQARRTHQEAITAGRQAARAISVSGTGRADDALQVDVQASDQRHGEHADQSGTFGTEPATVRTLTGTGRQVRPAEPDGRRQTKPTTVWNHGRVPTPLPLLTSRRHIDLLRVAGACCRAC